MELRITILLALLMLLGHISSTKAAETTGSKTALPATHALEEKDDLRTAASSYRSDWNRGYGVTGYGSIDDRYRGYSGGYDNRFGGSGYDGDYSRYGGNGYSGSSGYGGYDGVGYGSNSGYGGYGGGYGGYGGYSGNGGLNSYYGYNNPSYQGANNHLGYGYYNRRSGYGNIYNSGITPSLVTGYRGYSRK